MIYRRKKRKLTMEQIHAELDRICAGAPEVDAQAVLNDLRECLRCGTQRLRFSARSR